MSKTQIANLLNCGYGHAAIWEFSHFFLNTSRSEDESEGTSKGRLVYSVDKLDRINKFKQLFLNNQRFSIPDSYLEFYSSKKCSKFDV